MVRLRNKEKYGGGGKGSEKMETVPMAQNDLARELKG